MLWWWLALASAVIFVSTQPVSAAGQLDTNFVADADHYTYAAAVQADGRIYISGDFSSYGGCSQRRSARIHGDVLGTQPIISAATFSIRIMTAGGWTYHLD